ncbi:LysR family transcriptional regulator [Roseateles toxinivorans]|uniref:DNA-binding transcriptional LysR family regulator n=1 Tax=Roseateles toxinivorans TaxID=270368 RepID=A0A4R6QM37_9BURK|nr:LysR family transcriptional regulator [Roseateles toxinivorans]TDP63885.1 DNA-binding transcriptional LysR family regulator [Roseateles toxinivorans]
MTKTARISRNRLTAADAALDANALELFARIAQAGSFAQAARELGLTRAAVSRRVAAIEAAVGLALFARSTRSLGLTEAGRRLHARARSVHEAAEGARLALRSQRDQLGGTLRISAPLSFGRHVLAPLLARFQALHPALRYELLVTDRRVDLLREGLDLAFRITGRPPEDWVAQPVLRFAVRAYGAAGQTALSGPQSLASLPCLLIGQNEEARPGHWCHDDGAAEAVMLQAAAWGNDMDSLMEMARHGTGIVLLPDFCVGPASGLVDLLPGWRLLVDQGEWVHALTLPVPAGSETARALVRFVRDALVVPAA